jgi:hypothetical protein
MHTYTNEKKIIKIDNSVYKSNLDKKKKMNTIPCADDWILFLHSEGTENCARSVKSQDMMHIKHYARNQIRENVRQRSLTSETNYKNHV